MNVKTSYSIIIGEVGNEVGHVITISCVSDAAAIAKAKKECRAYNGDGWWRVERDGQTVDKGGRSNY